MTAGISSIPADQAMGPEQEQITDPSDRGDTGQGCKFAGFASILVAADYELIDLVKTKPGNLDGRVSDNEFLKFSFQFGNVPNTFLSQSIDGQSEQPLLRFVQVIYANAGYG